MKKLVVLVCALFVGNLFAAMNLVPAKVVRVNVENMMFPVTSYEVTVEIPCGMPVVGEMMTKTLDGEVILGVMLKGQQGDQFGIACLAMPVERTFTFPVTTMTPDVDVTILGLR